MNKGFTFFLLAFCLLFHACTKQTEVQPNEDAQANVPIAQFWHHTSDNSLVSNAVSTLKTMDVADSFEKYVSKFGRPLWDSSLTSFSPGGETPSSIIIPIVHRYKQFTNAAILGAYVGDKFQYRLVYRYYMPKELIQTADDKNRWESLFLAFDKQLFKRGQSSGFHRQEESRSGKGNASARYIEIAYTYCSTTYVVDSEGVPISPSYTTCSTEYIYQWLDDAPVYTPPTPTDPGNGSVPVNYPPPTGGGGTTAPPATTIRVDIYNNLKDPCLKAIVNALKLAQVKTAITNNLELYYGSNVGTTNLEFTENPNLKDKYGNPIAGETGFWQFAPGTGKGPTLPIYLNPSILVNSDVVDQHTSKEFVASVIFHEIVHAILTYSEYKAPPETYQHTEILNKPAIWIRDALIANYGISSNDAMALALGGLDNVLQDDKTHKYLPALVELAKNKYGIDLRDAAKIRDAYQYMTNGKGSRCP